ncbi:DUF6363 domain-containing protein [Zobellella sp. DQSA1]|uniref:DUF6363 domain-containing protein n=1 Tax=Zobellella sp. DQSA1 TaxID=3342386 RepID=UPI0035C0E60D
MTVVLRRHDHSMTGGELLQMVEAHERGFNDARGFISQPPADARNIEIFPHRPSQSRNLGANGEQLERGRRGGQYFLQAPGVAVQYRPRNKIVFCHRHALVMVKVSVYTRLPRFLWHLSG